MQICEICGRTSIFPQNPRNPQKLGCVYSPTDCTESTEPAAEENLPQIAQIYTDSLGAEDSSGGILASAAAALLGKN